MATLIPVFIVYFNKTQDSAPRRESRREETFTGLMGISPKYISLSPRCQISLLVKPLDFVPVGGFHWLPSVYTVEKAPVEVPEWDVVGLMAFVIVSL